MLDLNFIRNESERVREAIRLKNINLDLDRLLELDRDVRRLRGELQELERQRNENAAQMPTAPEQERPRLIEGGRKLSRDIQARKSDLSQVESSLRDLLLLVPNIPASDSLRGTTDADNVELRRVGIRHWNCRTG